MIVQILSASGLAAAALVCVYQRRRARIACFARQATRGSLSQRDAAFALGRVVFSSIERCQKNPIFLSRLLRPLGASPVAVLEEGGCCSGLHRLYITALDTLGIRSAQVTVFRRVDPVHAHCLAQVCIGEERLLIDVDYGVWLHDRQGAPIDVLCLRRGVVPAIEPFVFNELARYQGGVKTRPAGYPDRDYYRFDYNLTRTANWAMSPLRRIVYAILHKLTDGRIDLLFLPPLLEWPEILLSLALCAAALLVLVSWAVYNAIR